jgi:hypothetical protein
LGSLSKAKRLAASTLTTKRKNTNQNTPASTKRLKQTNLFHFLTPVSALNSFPNIQKLMLNDQPYDASNGREFAKELERNESSENSDSETNVADTSFVSNGSTLVDNPRRVRCGFVDCENLSVRSKIYQVRKQQQEKHWCRTHKWCSKCYEYELSGKCPYSIQIGLKSNLKVSPPLFQPTSSMTYHQQLKASLTHLLQLVGMLRRI